MLEKYAEALKEINVLIKKAHPAISEAMSALRDYGPEVFALAEAATAATVDIKAGMIKRYVEKHGFTKQEAIILTLDSWAVISDTLRASGNKKGGK